MSAGKLLVTGPLLKTIPVGLVSTAALLLLKFGRYQILL